MTTNQAWLFHGGILDSQLFEVEGLNVWQYEWRSSGETVTHATPLYPADPYNFSVYEIRNDLKTVRFAATELSNSVWGFLTPPDQLDKTK